ncbi:MAG: pyruvate ferredoxin oxidoreductase [Deltaproteobacteria bacterium]|nr:pyruvate ferredoxin oxidoreductase [Candidatus Anaeroferrophillus wilburensis]MBN2888817.1 pyruvate ferredoxin oxidoreductase [Deltaproteobacteria bacterium]
MQAELKHGARESREMMLGSDAIAHGVRLCRPAVISAYPITPQTHIIETLSEMVDTGELQSQFIKVESEMSAIAACLGAVSAGSRSFTATSSHGLAMMHEILHWFSGARMPLVMVNANRALGAPWNIWCDQSDSMSQRDVGWLQLYCETAQEALDSIILAYWLSEQIMLPVMVMIDGFILSHTMEQLLLPSQREVDAFLPPYRPAIFLDPENPKTFCAAAAADNFYQLKKAIAATMETAETLLAEGYALFAGRFGRSYGHVEPYCCDDAEVVFCCAGALSGTVRVAVDQLRQEGHRIGLVKLRLFRPFPGAALIRLLAGTKRLVVLNRSVSFGAAGTIAQELRAAFYREDCRPQIHDVIISLGGKEVFPATIREIALRAAELSPTESIWIG